MKEQDLFRELVRRVRDGDSEAARELVTRFEPVVRRAVRARLRDSALRREFDSTDICQSVLAAFFARAASGKVEVGEPRQLVALLVTMARNKLATRARRPQVRRRQEADPGPLEGADAAVDPHPGPGSVADQRDMLREVFRRLTDQERRLAEERAAGRSWDEIAAAVGGSAEALRKQLARALSRVTRELNSGGAAGD